MRSLLDSSVLIALLDEDHIFHQIAFEWFENSLTDGWASCPITENAALRVLSNLNYSKRRQYSLMSLVSGLNELIRRTDHEFWADDLSLLSTQRFAHNHILGPKQLTDVYLLGLAVARGGRLASFDRRIAIESVAGATCDNLHVLEPT